jgi:hypothetical protein
MDWLKVNKYHIRSGEFIIAKFFSRENVQYGLTHGNKSIGYFRTLAEAKENAEKIQQQST